MENTGITADGIGIHISCGNLLYCVEWWQLERDGVAVLYGHLKEKRWFTAALGRRFVQLCMRRRVANPTEG